MHQNGVNMLSKVESETILASPSVNSAIQQHLHEFCHIGSRGVLTAPAGAGTYSNDFSVITLVFIGVTLDILASGSPARAGEMWWCTSSMD